MWREQGRASPFPGPAGPVRARCDRPRSSWTTHTGAVVDGDHIIAICALGPEPPRAPAAPRHGGGHGDDQPRLPPGHGGRRHPGGRDARSATATCWRPWRPVATRWAASRAVTWCSPTWPRPATASSPGCVLADVVRAPVARWPSWPREAMTRLPQVLVNVRVGRHRHRPRWSAWPTRSPPPSAGSAARPGAGAAERDRAARPGDGGGGHPRRGRRRGRRARRRLADRRLGSVGRPGQ